MRSLGDDLVEMNPPPGFLSAWPPPIMTRRLAASNNDTANDETAVAVSDGHSSVGKKRWTVPDFKYRPPGTDECWNIEIKLWSVNGYEALDREVECLQVLWRT